MSKKLFIFAPLLAITAIALTPVASQAAVGQHWYKAGSFATAGTKVPTIGDGALTLTSLAGTIKCDNVSGGYAENPAGSGIGTGPAGVSFVETFSTYSCSGTCPFENRTEPFKLPWESEVKATEEPTGVAGKHNRTISINPSGEHEIEVVTGCWNLKGPAGPGTGPNGGPATGPAYSEAGAPGVVEERGEPCTVCGAFPLLHFSGKQNPVYANGSGTGPKASQVIFKKEAASGSSEASLELANANVGLGATTGSDWTAGLKEGELITTGP